MPTIKVSQIIVYPVKSTRGIVQPAALVKKEGFEHDRRWALVNERKEVITAREFPSLFRIATEVTADALEVRVPDFEPVSIPFQSEHLPLTEAQLFGKEVYGRKMSDTIDEVLSVYLGIRCSLISLTADHPRYMSPQYGGTATDPVSYADTAPFLVVSEATLDELNEKISSPLEMERFRPNLVLSGCEAGEEDRWERILIGNVILEQSEACKRCVMTTLGPVTGDAHRQQEPLRTLSGYRRHPRGGVRFGINMIPRIMGVIHRNDVVEVL